MPSNIVNTPKDEKLWKKAKERASSQYDVDKDSDRYWAITTGIYKRMKGGDKKAAVFTKLSKSDFMKLAKEVATDYFTGKDQSLTDLVVKQALAQEMNDAQIQTLCTTTNHMVHAAIRETKEATDDQSVEFEMARPELVVEKVADLCEAPDPVYLDIENIFAPRINEEKEAEEETTYGEELQRTVREEQIIRQNIMNVANAHSKVATDILMEDSKIDEAVERLYALIRQAVENGKDPEILKDVLGKAFDDKANFEVVWDDMMTRLIADNVIERPPLDIDRGDSMVDTVNWAPNRNAPIIATAMNIDRRITKMRELDSTLHGLEKMAHVAGEDLESNLLLQKTAFSGGAVKVLRGIGKWLGPKFIKSKTVTQVAAKKPKSLIRKAGIGAVWGSVDAGFGALPKVERFVPKKII